MSAGKHREPVAVEPVDFRSRMAHVPTSVSVAAAMVDGRPLGLIIGTFTSVSLDPPLVGFLADRSSSTIGRLLASGRIAFSVLAGSAYPAVTQSFRGSAETRFNNVDWEVSPTGSPLVHPAVLHVEGPVLETAGAGDHIIVRVAPEVVETSLETDPLVFWGGRMMTVSDTRVHPAVWQLGELRDAPDPRDEEMRPPSQPLETKTIYLS